MNKISGIYKFYKIGYTCNLIVSTTLRGGGGGTLCLLELLCLHASVEIFYIF